MVHVAGVSFLSKLVKVLYKFAAKGSQWQERSFMRKKKWVVSEEICQGEGRRLRASKDGSPIPYADCSCIPYKWKMPFFSIIKGSLGASHAVLLV